MDTATLPVLAAGSYVHWGVIQISVANLIVIGLMLLLFIAALLVPFPAPHRTFPPSGGTFPMSGRPITGSAAADHLTAPARGEGTGDDQG